MRKIILAAMAALALTACGSQSTPQSEAVQETEETTVQEEETTEAEEETEAEIEAIPLQCGDQIDNENFSMTFDSIELLPEYSYQTSEYSTTSLYVEEGYQLVLVKGHIENKSTSVISDSSFNLTAVVNDEYVVDGFDVRLNFIRDKYFEIDPYTDLDYVLYINIPNKLADMFETVTFNIGFNDDMSNPETVFNSDGTSTTETDNLYALTGELSSGSSEDAGEEAQN
ncbi:MAG TPA: hypothetical protein IAA07_03775 [Candidatus Lachnoclostridium stercoravium]|uniref:Lipoprotein n=1 Tax=Candidatus Lachnoclostridium stercoravium TaxID=2838633 RepID=A0A9D2HG08_9FIRM|nr:hypothetical protein [Candidatus Lachnoclostridium stercoravium]